MSKRTTTTTEQEVLEFLNTLRNSGAINMYGARPYIVENFGLSRKESDKLLTLWMDNFNEEGNYTTVKEK